MNIDFKSIILVLIQLACIIFILLTGNIFPRSFTFLVVFVIAVAFGTWALWTVNIKNFRITPGLPKNIRIVAKGPYRIVRHPMYTSVLLATLMIVIDDFSPIRACVWIVLLIDLYLKLMYEEKLIINRNTDYLIYKKSTRRLIPFIH